MTKLKNSICDQNSKCGNTPKLKMWINSKTHNMTTLQKSKCDVEKKCDKTFKKISTKRIKLNCDKTHKLELWKKFKTSDCDNTQKLKLWQNSITQIGRNYTAEKNANKFFGNNNLTPSLPMRYFWGSHLQSCKVFPEWFGHNIYEPIGFWKTLMKNQLKPIFPRKCRFRSWKVSNIWTLF